MDNVECSICKSSNDFPYNSLSTNIQLFEELKHKLTSCYNASILIKSSFYKIIKSSSPGVHTDNDQLWAGRVQEFLTHFENDQLERSHVCADLPPDFVQLLRMEKYFEKWQKINLKIEYVVATNSLILTGTLARIEIVTKQLDLLAARFLKETFQIGNHLVTFIFTFKEYIDNYLKDYYSNCVLLNKSNELDSITLLSLKANVAQKYFNLLTKTFKSETYHVPGDLHCLLESHEFKTFKTSQELLNMKQKQLSYLMIENLDKSLTYVGEQLLVSRLLNELKQFFDQYMVQSKYLKFSYEDMAFLKICVHDEIKKFFADLNRSKIKPVVEFQFELDKILNSIELFKLKITANSCDQEKIANFLNKLVQQKQTDKCELQHFDSQALVNLNHLELMSQCVILTPIHETMLHVKPNTFSVFYDNIEILVTSGQANRVDAVVVCVDKLLNPNTHFNLDMTMQNELEHIKKQNNIDGQVYVTPAGELNTFKYVLFAVLTLSGDEVKDEENFELHLSNCVFNSLTESDLLSDCQSIAFAWHDSLGPFYDTDAITIIVVNTILDYLSKARNCSLKQIILAEPFHQQSFINFLTEKSQMPYSPIRLRKELIEENECSNGIFKLISNAKYKLNQARAGLEKLADDSTSNEVIENEYFKEIDPKTQSLIENECTNEHTRFKWDQNKLHIRGLHKNVTKSMSGVMKIITNHALIQQRHTAAQLTQLQNKAIQLPPHWNTEQEMCLIELNPTSDEFLATLNYYKNQGLPVQRVVSIQRVQNKHLYFQYKIYKEKLEKLYGNANEHTLFHGTAEACVNEIWTNGFNRNHASKSKTCIHCIKIHIIIIK